MGWLEPTHLMFLLVSIAVVAALSLHIASAVAQAKRRRSRRYFVLGFSAGWTAATIFRGRRRRPRTLRALADAARRAGPGQIAMVSRLRLASPLSASKK